VVCFCGFRVTVLIVVAPVCPFVPWSSEELVA